MDKLPCIILAGGKGSRLRTALKFLINICGKPLLIELINDLKNICKYIVIALSKRTTRVSHICREDYLLDCIETSGEDYVKDLDTLLKIFPKPLLVTAADIYVIYKNVLEDFIRRAIEMREDIITLALNVNGTEKLVGIALFKNAQGSWRNISYPESYLLDIDDFDDLKKVKNMVICRNYNR